MNIDIFVAVLPWLAILACPLMMILMMLGMTGSHCHTKAKVASQRGAASATADANVDEIQELRARLARLEAAANESTSRAGVGT